MVEICVDSLESARNAVLGEAGRLELCSELSVGGLTPDPGLLDAVLVEVDVPVYAMIRPRGGSFSHNESEFQVMLRSVDTIVNHWPKVAGFVFGILTAENRLDVARMKQLKEAAKGRGITLHRAFDSASDSAKALEDAIEAGCERILCSGCKGTAVEGQENLKELIKAADGRITIMPGGGIPVEKVKELLEVTGAKEIHLSGKRMVPVVEGSEEMIPVTDAAVVRAVVGMMDR